MEFQQIIAARRDALVHSGEQLSYLANGAARGEIPDYQLSAWLMAAVLNPLTFDETVSLTRAMADSGERLDLTSLPKPWVDKHSTGGVGDKTTLVALPLLAACGVTAVKMSGRGLGITGGTVDKLSSVPGFRLDLTPQEMIAQAGRIGIALTGQTPALAPADKALYALRDATATVNSLPLIVGSILSKKIAAGAETIVIDVKCGSGAFMRELPQAQELARWLRDVGARCGVNVRTLVTDMDQPLGHAVGNALEVREAIDVLLNRSPGRFEELCVQLVGLTLSACGKASSLEAGQEQARSRLTDGSALAKARAWFQAQGADPTIFDTPNAFLPSAPTQVPTVSNSTGFVRRIDARAVGEIAVDLGAGRRRKSDEIDPAVGIVLNKQVGDAVQNGETLATIHAATAEAAAQAAERLRSAFTIGDDPPGPTPIILEST